MNIHELINDRKTTIVDVRTEEEFLEGNVQGSINIPLPEVVDRVEELKQMQPLVLCCLSGVRSGKATLICKPKVAEKYIMEVVGRKFLRKK